MDCIDSADILYHSARGSCIISHTQPLYLHIRNLWEIVPLIELTITIRIIVASSLSRFVSPYPFLCLFHIFSELRIHWLIMPFLLLVSLFLCFEWSSFSCYIVCMCVFCCFSQCTVHCIADCIWMHIERTHTDHRHSTNSTKLLKLYLFT